MSLSFAANGDRVQHASNAVYDLGATGTLCAWVYANEDTQRKGIIRRDGTTAYWELGWRSDLANDPFQLFRQRATSDLSATANAASFANYGLNKWLFICAVFDTGGAASDQRLLIGDLDSVAAEPSAYATQTAGTGTVSSTYVASDVCVGNVVSATTREWRGRIAHVQILNIALTPEQIIEQQWYPHVRSGTVLFCHYGFPGTTCTDLSGNVLNGTVTGATNDIHVPLPPFFGSRQGWQGAFTSAAGGGGRIWKLAGEGGSLAGTQRGLVA